MTRRVLLLCSFVLLELLRFAICTGQPQEMKFQRLPAGMTLSQDIVTSIVQDKQGFMWFGTEDGLNRYDGYSVTVYKHDPHNPSSLSSDDIVDLLADDQGKLWVATPEGLNLFDPRQDSFIRFQADSAERERLSDSHITCLARDSVGDIWVGTLHGLNRLDTAAHRSISFYRNPDDTKSLNSDEIRCLLTSRTGKLWVGTQRGLFVYDRASNAFRSPPIEKEKRQILERCIIRKAYEDHSGNLWLSIIRKTDDWLLMRYEPATGKAAVYAYDARDSLGLSNPSVLAMQEDQRGNLWIGTFAGLNVWDPAKGGFHRYYHDPENPSSLTADRVYALYKDHAGTLWIGVYRGAVCRIDFNTQKFAHYAHNENVYAIAEGHDGTIWAGTNAGILHYGQDMEPIANPLYLQKAVGQEGITALLEDRRGNLWIGTEVHGLLRIDGQRHIVTRLDPDLHDPRRTAVRRVRAIYEDREGELWIGREASGLDRFDPVSGGRRHYDGGKTRARGLQGSGVWCIYQDHRGSLWFGGWGSNGCLNRFDKGTAAFTAYRGDPEDPNTIYSGSVRSIYEDASGYLWLGTWGGGVNRFDPNASTSTAYTTWQGLPSNYVKAMLPDAEGNLWISTEKGLSRFSPGTKAFRNFTAEDGLQSDFFWTGSAYRSRNGQLYFGGTNGFNMFLPDSIHDNRSVPPVAITNITVLDKPLLSGLPRDSVSAMTLTYDQDYFSFEFVALDYAAPERNLYAYKLEGVDPAWVQAGTRRYAAYAHLAPGSYVFRVKASNNDGVWNERGASVAVTILPPFWATWWFRLCVFTFLAGSLYGFHRYRLERRLEIEHLRQRIAADLHDEVGSNLSSIVLASQLIAREDRLPDTVRSDVEEIRTTALETSEMMKEIVWVLNPSNDSLDDLLLKMKTLPENVLRGVSYVFKGPPEKMSAVINLETKRNVLLIYKEILTNIAKHADATAVEIHVAVQGPRFLLSVRDNGRGFQAGSPELRGNGLTNIRTRAAQIDAELTFESSPGHGTAISIGVGIT